MNISKIMTSKILSPKKWLLRALYVLALILFIFLFIFNIWFIRIDLTKLEVSLAEPTQIYDVHGKLITEMNLSGIEAVTFGQVPEHLKNAVIATEDRRFYNHSGIDARSIMRALWRDIQTQSFDEGGSTISQQLAKNMLLSAEKTLSRKLKEAAYALKIEQHYSKDEILLLYLNNIYYGEGQWGVEHASKTYFNKTTSELSLVESATLAGLLKAPTTYSPARNMEASIERRNLVLGLMNDQKMITDSEYQQAEESLIVLTKSSEENAYNQYGAFMDKVISEAVELYGYTESQLLSNGLHIYTTMDSVIQQAADDVYQDESLFPESSSDQMIQSGLVIIDQSNGEIRAMVGRRGSNEISGFNFATNLKRQPGSSMKPLSVYGPALEQGFTPASILPDKELNISGYQPQNYDGLTRGDVTLEEALVNSYNIPAVWLLNEIGINSGIDFATRTGVELTKEDRHLGLALGGLSQGTSPLLMAQAFSAFANLGEMYPSHSILAIHSSDGKMVTKGHHAPKRVTTPEVAYTMTTLLTNAVSHGTGNAAMLERPTAGKTGTTQLPATSEFEGITDGMKDAWFVGYTPELTAAIWMGYEHTDRDHYLTTGSSAAASIFQQILSRALVNKPIVPFSIPDSMQPAKPNKSQKDKNDESIKNDNKGKGNGKGRKNK